MARPKLAMGLWVCQMSNIKSERISMVHEPPLCKNAEKKIVNKSRHLANSFWQCRKIGLHGRFEK